MILDTNALSALADGDEALGRRLAASSILSVPVVVLGEYRYGILGSRHRAAYEAWLAENLPCFDILGIDAATAEAYAGLRRELRELGRPMPGNDIWVAALARQYGLPVVSRDRHFAEVPGMTAVDW